jgi:hypothetical protein
MDTDALIEKDYLLQLKEGPISKFIKYYENIISDDEKSKLSAKEGKGIIIHVQGFSIVLDNNEIDEQEFDEYKEIYELVDDNYKFDESKKPPKIPETPAIETHAVETPAVETPAIETPAIETPAIETPETPAIETPAVETTETPAVETTEASAPATMKKKKKPKKNKTQKKKGRKKNKKNQKNKKKKKNKKKSQRGGMEKGLQDDLTEGLFGVSSKKLSDMTSGRAVGNTEGQKTGETTRQPTARILADIVVDDNYYANKTLKKPSVKDFVPKDTDKKSNSTALASGKSFSMNDSFGLRRQGAPPLVVRNEGPPIGHALFRKDRDDKKREITKGKISDLTLNTRKTCTDLQAREEQIANLKEKTSKMSKNADDFAEAMKALKKQQQNQGCVVSGGKKSRRKKKKNKKKKNRKKSTRKKRRK